MNGLEGKSERLLHFIIGCASVTIAAVALGMLGGGYSYVCIWALAAVTIAAVCIANAAVSQKKMYDGAMRDSAEQLRTLERDLKFFTDIYELNPCVLFLVDDHMRVTDCNRACVEFIGADDKLSLTEELTNRVEADLPRYTPADGYTESMAETIREAGRAGFSRISSVIRTHDGEDHNISVSYSRIPVEDGFVLAGASVDVTEFHRVREELNRKNRMLDLINRIAVLLGSLDSGDMVRRAAEITGRVMDVDRIYIWKNSKIDGNLHYVPEFVWTRSSVPDNVALMPDEGFPYFQSIPCWEELFAKGLCVNGPLGSLSEIERERLAPYGIKSILVMPLFLRNKFWGFVSFDDCRGERVFAEEEVGILRSASVMIVSSLLRGHLEHIQSEYLPAADYTDKITDPTEPG